MSLGGGTPSFARGVRFRRLDDGRGVLLIPEGVVNLNATAAAVAELLDGTRSTSGIAAELCVRFGAPSESIAADVEELLSGLAQRGWVFFSSQSVVRE